MRISVKIFTGKEMFFNEGKEYHANKIPSCISGKVQFWFGSGFYGVFDLFVLKLQGFFSCTRRISSVYPLEKSIKSSTL